MAANGETESRRKGEKSEHQQWQILLSVPQNQGNYRSWGHLERKLYSREELHRKYTFSFCCCTWRHFSGDPPRFPAQVTTVNILTRRWPCSSGVLDEGFCVWAMLTPVCYPTSGLEETVSSWEKALPGSAQEKHLSLHFPFMAEATSPLNPWLLARMNVFVLLMFYRPSSWPCTCLFYWVGKHWDQGHLHSADTLCTIIDSQF